MFSKLRKIADAVSDSLTDKVKGLQENTYSERAEDSDGKSVSIESSTSSSVVSSDNVDSWNSCTSSSSGTISTVSSCGVDEKFYSVCSSESNWENNGKSLTKSEILSSSSLASENHSDQGTSSLKIETVLSYFEEHERKYADLFSPSSLMEKIAKFAKKAGVQFIYKALLLFYGLKSDEIPSTNKMIAIAGLGYFIAPFDLLADILPGGFIDDGFVLSFALDQVYSSLSKSTKQAAKLFLHEIFGAFDDDDLN